MSGEIDLSELQLLPQWAKEPLQQNPYQNYEGETAPRDRDRRGGRDDRGRGGPPRRPSDSRGRDSQRPPQNRGPRPEGGGSGGNGPRPSGPRRDAGGRPDNRNNRNDRFQRDDRREERPPENLPPLEVLFQPEPHGAESMVKQIKSSGRSYPVFELARMILKKPERHQVTLHVPQGLPPETAPQLFLCVPDQSLWLSESDAVEHLLKKQRDTFYQAERVAIDPPKGNFTSIAVCGLSGAVLGPPNHHAYPAAVRKLHLDRFSDMPLEAFKSRIRLVKDEAVLTQWKDQQSWKTEYVVKDKFTAAQVTPQAAVVETPPAPAEKIEESTVTEIIEVSPSPETTGSSETEVPAEATETGTVTPEASIEEEPASETKIEEPAPASKSLRLPNLEAVRAHFIAEHQAAQIQSVTSFVLNDLKARQQSDPVIQKVVRRAWDSEVRFPAKTGPALIHSLSKNGLQFFKWNKGITHVASVRPKRFDPAKSPVAEGVSKILDWVTTHPGKTRADLVKALVPETVPAAAPISTPAVVPPATATSTPEVSATAAVKPVPAKQVVETPAVDSSTLEASSVLSDLHWLLHEGYVVEFANNQLDLLRQNDKPANPPATKKAPAVVATAPASTPVAEPAPVAEVTPKPTTATAEVEPSEPEVESSPEPEKPSA